MTRPLAKLLALAVCVLAFAGAATLQRPAAPAPAADPPAAPPAPDGLSFVVAPYLQFPTRTAITILWETSRPGDAVVQYGTKLPLDQNATGKGGQTLHEVELTGLEPSTKYFYQVRTTDADGRTLTGPLLTLLTAVDADAAFSFTIVGDTQRNPTITGKIGKLMWDRRPHFVLHLGDVVDSGPDKAQWTHDLFGPCAELFGRVPLVPTIGNHERNHAFYYQYFALPPPEYYYRFRYGNADFFAVDTNKPVGPDSEQFQWLDRELAKSDATWKFVFHHHPAFTSDDDDYGNTWKGSSTHGDRNVRNLVPLYEKHHVDVVFNGHIHVYERTWPLRAGKVDHTKGVVYLTSGGGGGRLENFGPTPTWFKAELKVDFHYCYATIQGGRFHLKAIDQHGQLFDTLEIRK